MDDYEDSISDKTYIFDRASFPDYTLGFVPLLGAYYPSKVLGNVAPQAQESPHQLYFGMTKRNCNIPELHREGEEEGSEAMIQSFKLFACRKGFDFQSLQDDPIVIDQAAINEYVQKLPPDKASGLLSRASTGSEAFMMNRPADAFLLSVKRELKVLGTAKHVDARQKSQVIQEADQLLTLYLGSVLNRLTHRLKRVLLDHIDVSFGMSPDDAESKLNYHVREKPLKFGEMEDAQETVFKACTGQPTAVSKDAVLDALNVIMVDFASFDKSQNRISALCVIKFLKLMGVPEDILGYFRLHFGDVTSSHRLYKFRALFGQMMKSGCIVTLFANNVVNLCAQTRVFREIVRDARYVSAVGDDSCIWTFASVSLIRERIPSFATMVNLEAKLEVGCMNYNKPNTIPPFYCGTYIVQDSVTKGLFYVPCPIKKIFKIKSIMERDFSMELLEARAMSYREEVKKMTRSGIIEGLHEAVCKTKHRDFDTYGILHALTTLFSSATALRSCYGDLRHVRKPDTVFTKIKNLFFAPANSVILTNSPRGVRTPTCEDSPANSMGVVEHATAKLYNICQTVISSTSLKCGSDKLTKSLSTIIGMVRIF